MGVPININTESCSAISSNCVVWQGPDIPCISLCHGDSITNVMYELAVQFCAALDQLKVSGYNIDCLPIVGCPPETFQELFQLVIDTLCNIQAQPGVNGSNGNYTQVVPIPPAPETCVNGGVAITTYNGVTNAVINTYNVCNGEDGDNGLPGIQGVRGDYVQTSEATLDQCPTGGIVVTVLSGEDDSIVSEETVCNGADGLQGPQGIPGEPGEPGAPGEPGLDGDSRKLYFTKLENPGTTLFSGNYTVPANVSQLIVELWGGGTAAQGFFNGSTRMAVGGTSGGYLKVLINVSPGQIIPYTIAGETVATNVGQEFLTTDGQDTTFNTTNIAEGGKAVTYRNGTTPRVIDLPYAASYSTSEPIYIGRTGGYGEIKPTFGTDSNNERYVRGAEGYLSTNPVQPSSAYNSGWTVSNKQVAPDNSSVINAGGNAWFRASGEHPDGGSLFSYEAGRKGLIVISYYA